MPETDRDRIPRQRERPTAFVELSGAYWGEGAGNRSWHVAGTSDGWRLEFFDVDEEEPVLVGVYPTADEAKRRSEVVTGRRRSPTTR